MTKKLKVILIKCTSKVCGSHRLGTQNLLNNKRLRFNNTNSNDTFNKCKKCNTSEKKCFFLFWGTLAKGGHTVSISLMSKYRYLSYRLKCIKSNEKLLVVEEYLYTF